MGVAPNCNIGDNVCHEIDVVITSSISAINARLRMTRVGHKAMFCV